jgi:hypothetical protein
MQPAGPYGESQGAGGNPARTEEAGMNPYLIQHVAAARAADLRKQAAAARRVRLARRARRGGVNEQPIT